MKAKNIKSKKARGFTIIELLVVIVVIGILAAITIVSYSGITNRAKTSKAQTNADSVLNVADVYAADNGVYPTVGQLPTSGSSANLPTGVSVTTSAPTKANGETTVGNYTTCGTNTTGASVTYYDFGTPTTVTIKTGTGC